MSDLVNQPLDPFAFFQGAASRIGGLGGDGAPQDPTYVLHTLYVPTASGKRHFTVRFDGLTASTGTLLLRVHMLPPEVGAHAKLMNSQRIPLEQLAALGGEAMIGFDGYPGMAYALYGAVADSSDARADGLQVFLDLALDPNAQSVVTAASSTSAVAERIAAKAQIVTLDAPTFTLPVSQAYTASQMKEAAARDWAGRLAGLSPDPRAIWTRAIIGRIVERYGLLTAGHRVLGIGSEIDTLPRLFVAAGLDVTVADLADPRVIADQSERPEESAPDSGGVTTLTVDHDFRIAPDIGLFDFLWSQGVVDSLPRGGGLAFVMQALEAIRPGGLSAHILHLETDPASDHDRYRAADMERWALTLIAHGYEMAQLKLPRTGEIIEGKATPPTRDPFVFLVRRPD